jgi:AmmeMemoRadiSam system protein B
VQEASAHIKSRRNPVSIYSVGCISTVSSLLASNASQGVSDDDYRRPAIANAFYPADATERKSLVASFKAKIPSDVVPQPALAIMTPHAGLKYSGQVAMDVWGRVKLPSTLLVIGPKHTAYGREWAVSPSRAWELPGGSKWDIDRELADKIVQNVDGMEFDLAAHAREHGVEIQLPILEALTPENERPKLVAVALKGASMEEIMHAADQLADVLRDLPEKPLLVISSDMNHFAPEAENRRRDRLAIDAMLTGDPVRLIEVCQNNSISMCGLVPAAIIMQTLIKLGQPFQVEEISYDNSGTLGDPNRVVGYAGVIFRSNA